MADPVTEPPTATLVVFTAGLALATYLQSALLEYPSAWLGPLGALAGVACLVAVQVLLAGLLYRRVRSSSETYSLFFRRAALIVLATFVTLTAVLLVPRELALLSRDLHGAASLGALVTTVLS